MEIAAFREKYGTAFYGFINSELGQAMLAVLEKNDPATRVASLPPEIQTSSAVLFLGQTTGWRDCVLTIKGTLIVPEEGPAEPEATYEREDETLPAPKRPERQSAPTPPPASAASRTKAKPKRKK